MPQCTVIARSTGEQCKKDAIVGGTVCASPGHGGTLPSVKAAAARRVAEQKARAAVEAAAAKTGRIVAAGQDPLTVLENALSNEVAIAERLGSIVERLSDDALRYRGRAGEQIRGELTAYQASLRDCVRTAEALVKLGLAERRQNVAAQQAQAIVAILASVFDRLDLTREQRELTRRVVPEELRAASERFDAEQQTAGRRPAAA